MKKIINFALVAGLAIGAVSCANDGVGDDISQIPAQTGEKLTFVLPTTAGGITYAIASNDEMALDLSQTAVYMFDASDNLEAIITNIQPGSTGGKTTATIVKDKAWDGNKNFVFVGNNARASQLPTATGMSLADFQNILTNAHSQNDLLATPLMLTSGLKAVADVKTAPAIITGDVSLYRNVARFDIDNNVSVGNVEIKKVYVNDAKLDGYVFGYQKAAIGGTTIGDLEFAVAASTTVGAEEVQKEESLFYIYPTNIAADGSETTLQLVGEVNGVAKIFTLNKYDINGDPIDLEIKANKRYIISAIDALTMTFSLVVADWDEGESIVGKPDASVAPLNVVGLGAGSIGTFNGVATIKVPTTGGTVLFSTSASTAQGTTFTVSGDATGSMVDVSASIAPGVSQTAGGVVYARPYYESLYEVVVPILEANETSITTITVTDPANGATIDVYIYHEAELGDVIPVSDMLFPDDGFRNYILSLLEVSAGDNITKTQFESITDISRGATNSELNRDINSIEGIQYFTKLTKLYLPNSNVAKVDLSQNTKLTYLRLSGTPNLEELDLSNNPLIQGLYLDNAPALKELKNIDGLTKLSAVEISDTKLTEFTIPSNNIMTMLSLNRNAELTTVNNTNNQANLKTVYANNCSKLSSLDLSGCTVLNYCSLQNSTNLSSLDLTGCTSLSTLNVSYNEVIESLNLSDCAALQNVSLVLNTQLSTVTFPAAMPDIKELSLAGSPISVFNPSAYPSLTFFAIWWDGELLDLSQNVNLERLAMNESKFTTLDISKNNKIVNFYTPRCPNLETVYVWDGFDVENPELHFNKRFDISDSPKVKFVVKK